MTTPSGEFPWEAANATDGLAWYAGQGIGDWKLRMAENVMRSFLSIGLFALRVPFTDDLADAVIGPDAELDGEIPSLEQVSGFLQGKWDQLDDIGDLVQPIVDVFTAVLAAVGGDFSDLPTVIQSFIEGIGSLLTGWIIDPSRLPLIPLGSIFIPGLGAEPNLLTGFGDFGGADTIDDPSGAWSWDASVGRTTAGAAKATADGNRKVLVGDLIPSREDQKFNVSAWTRWTALVVAAGVDAIEVNVRAYAGGTQLSETTLATIASPVGTSSWVELAGEYTVPAGADGVRVCLSVEAACTAGEVWFDDVTGKRPGLLPQIGVDGLPEALANLLGYIEDLVDSLLGKLDIPIVGDLLDRIFDLSDGIESWKLGTDGLFDDLLTNPGSVIGAIPQGNLPIVSDVIKAVTGFTSGQGAPASSNVLADMLSALGSFAGSTNATSQTADQAQGIGSNALTNTVSIQSQVQSIVERQDQGWSARPLWGSMDFTADATFPKHLMNAHTHDIAGNSTDAAWTGSRQTLNTTAGGDSHKHDITMAALAHTHGSGTLAASATNITPAVVNATTAFLGYIRCGSVQEKRLFTFLAQATGTVSTFNLDVYRMAPDGGLTLAYSSASFAGAITGTLGWVQHAIPSGTSSITTQAGDILAIQLRMTGTGSVALGGITTPLPLNPVGWYPLRESAVRNPATPAPATIAAATANAQHTSTAIPFIEAGIDTGLAAQPMTITDNFNGSLSSLWMMVGPNALGISSNQLGIVDGSSSGYSWGTFRQGVNTDNMRVGFTVSAPSGVEQIVWFHGRDVSNHVGLAITGSHATLYTMIAGTRTNRTSIAIGTVAASYEIRVTGTAYTVWRNGVQIGSWTDTGAVAPSGRNGGVGLQAVRTGWFGLTWVGANPIDDWLLADI